MAQVAERSGVSRAAASFVLNGKGHMLKADTCERVKKAAEELGYRPNASALAVSTGRFGCAALLQSIDTRRNYLTDHILDGIEAALAKMDMHLVFAAMSDSDLTDEANMPKFLRKCMADGLLINYSAGIPELLSQRIERFKIPAIWINSKQAVNAVHPDDVAGGRMATERLIDKGHRKIAYVDYRFPEHSESPAHYSTADREAGYAQAMLDAGLAPLVVRPGGHLRAESVAAFTESWLACKNAPTAAIAYNPVTARPVILAAMCRIGKQIPRDFSIVTYHNEMLDDMGVSVSTVLLPEREMGERAVEMLLSHLERPSLRSPSVALMPKFCEGCTCGPRPVRRNLKKGIGNGE